MVSSQLDLSGSPTIISQTFQDVDQANTLVRMYRPDSRVKQLSLDPYQVRLDQANFGDLNLIFAEMGSPIHFSASRRSGFIHFSTELTGLEEMGFLHGHAVNSSMLWSFDPHRSANTIFRVNALVPDIQVRRELFEATCQAMGRDDLGDKFLRTEILYSPTTLRVFQHYLKDLLYLIKTDSSLLTTPEYRQMILGDFLPILIDAIPNQSPAILPGPKRNRRSALVRRAEEFIQENLDKPLTLNDVYTTLGISRRTLHYSFESIFGVTPLSYIKAQRLQGIRQALKHSDPGVITLKQVAQQWGYWHSGTFSKEYKSMFGESPSETLKQSF